MGPRRWVVIVGTCLGLAVLGCTPTAAPPTQLAITTNQVVCGGAYHPGEPPCTTNPTSRSVEVSAHGTVVASGTSGVDGTLVVDVPVGDLVVSVPGALPYMNCDTPSVTAVAAQTTAVTQTCTLLAP